eukprot:1922694-Rhodomonas_salina.2
MRYAPMKTPASSYRQLRSLLLSAPLCAYGKSAVCCSQVRYLPGPLPLGAYELSAYGLACDAR